jgi:hypothetical protein
MDRYYPTSFTKFLFIVLIALAFYGCRKTPTDDTTVPGTEPTVTNPTPVATTAADITSAKIELTANTGIVAADVACTINAKNEIIGILPNVDAAKKLVLSFTTRTAGATVKNGNTTLVSGTTVTDFSKAVILNTQAADGSTKTYKVMIKVFTGLPILNLTTAGPVNSKDVYVKGSMVVNANTEFEQTVTNIPLQIKGRGNSTWVMYPKKPYRLKFDTKTAMLGMPAAKNWVLLANYNDKTLMRNRIALMLGKRLGADWTSDSRFVEVFMNGDFLGNYLLTSQVEVNESRVNINELKPANTSEADITGGYLMELDVKMDEVNKFKTKKGLPFSLKSPEDITPAQMSYITNYMQQTEDALFSANIDDPINGYAKYINADSFINWYFTEEIFQTTDARDFSSIFYYKDRGGKLGMGPIWDFDTSAGNVDYADSKNPTGIWYIRDANWMFRLALAPSFNTKIRQRWAAIKDKEVQQIFTDIDETAAYLKLSQEQNFKRWPILGTYVYPNAFVFKAYDDEVWYLKDFLTKRVNWINSNIGYW